MPYRRARNWNADINCWKQSMVVALLSMLLLSTIGSASFALTPQEELQQILNQIPAEWWNGGWNKLAELETFIQSHPDQADLCATAQFYVGAYYNGVKQYEKSVEAHQTVLARYPTAKECPKSLWEIGYIQQHRLKNLTEAIRAYKQITNIYGESGEAPKAMLALGMVYQRAKQYDAAIQTYQDLRQRYPDADEAPRSLLKAGAVYGELKKKDLEMQSFNQVLQTYGQTKYAPEAKFLMGECFMEEKAHEKAIAAFKEVVADYPGASKAPAALIDMGRCYREQKKWDEESVAYQEVLKKYGNTEHAPRANFELGECYKIVKKYDAAVEVLRNLVWKYPKSEEAPRALLTIGMIYREMKKFDDELAMYQKVVEHFGGTRYARSAQFKIGEFYGRAKDHEKAIASLEEFVLNAPDAEETPRALMKLAEIRLDLKDVNGAVQTYQQVSDSYPTSEYAARAKLEIGRQHVNSGDVEKAKAYFSQVIADNLLVPGSPLILARLELGDISGSTGDHDGAFNQYKEAYCVPYHSSNLSRDVIERLYREFQQLDKNYDRANRFVGYQVYGPIGEDGVRGTADDLVDPLLSDASESVRIIENRREELSQKENLELIAFLLQKLGKFTEAATTNKQIVARHETSVKDPTTPKSVRIAALKQLLLNTSSQKLPAGDPKLYKEAIRRRQEKCREIVSLARQMGAEYAGDNQQKFVVEIEAEAAHLIANGYELLGDVDGSIREYNALLAKPLPLDWELFCKFITAQLHEKKGEDDKAIAIFRRVIQDHWQHPNWPAAAHFELAQLYRQSNDLKQARKELEEIVGHYAQSAWFDAARKRLAQWQ